METMTWLYLIGGLVVLFALVVFWRRLLRAALVLAGLAVALAVAWAFAMQATATRQTATAATVAATGSAAGNVATGALALALLAVIAGGYVLWLRWQMGGGQPQRLGNRNALALDAGGMGDALNALVQIELLRALRDLRDPGPAALPGYTWEDDNGGDYDKDAGGDAGPLWW